MRELVVQIFGTGCFVDRRDADPFKKRLILPVDNVFEDEEERHIPYVEFPNAKIKDGNLGDLSPIYRRAGKGGTIDYRRFELARHVITIENIHPETSFTVMQSYVDHVPQMRKVAPGLEDRPRSECFDAEPEGKIMAAFFDLSRGILKAGTLFEFVTRFEKKTGPTGYKVHTPEFVEFLVPITSDDLTVSIRTGDTIIRVVLDSTADVISIGNQPLADILGSGSGEDIRRHFKMYYNLSKDQYKPADPPLPVKDADPVNGCTETNWP